MPKPVSAFLAIFAVVLFSACSTNNVTNDESLRSYFDSAGVKGTFGLYDNGQGHFTIYNLARFRDTAYTPGATFDIFQSLLAIQRGVVKDEKAVLDSVSLTQAFQSDSAINDVVFRQLAVRIGKDSLKKWVDSIRYGNRDLTGAPDSAFWKDGHLKITADEQMGLVKKLYFDQLPFFKHTQASVRGMFNKEENTNYRLTYKTGKVQVAPDRTLGWMVGWEEENKHAYFFVVNMESANPQLDVPAVGLQLVKKILRPMGFFDGKK